MARLAQCVTFDLDDTLWDHRRAQAEVLGEIGESVVGAARAAEFVRTFHRHNGRLWERYRDGEIDADRLQHERFARTLTDVDADPTSAADLAAEFLDRYARRPYLREGARRLLSDLDGRIRIGCVTDGFTVAQRRKLEATAIAGHFEFLLTAEEAGHAKPSADLYRAVVELAGCEPGRIVHVGDSFEKDVVGAARCGLRTVWIPHPEHDSPAETAGLSADWEISSLAELPALLGLSGSGR